MACERQQQTFETNHKSQSFLCKWNESKETATCQHRFPWK